MSSSSWERNWPLLEEFWMEHGHCRVPLDYEDHELAEWTRSLRSVDKSALTSEQQLLWLAVEETMEIDDDDDDDCKISPEEEWERHWPLLEEFRREHGHCRIPADYQDQALVAWVGSLQNAAKRNELNTQQKFALMASGLDGFDFSEATKPKSSTSDWRQNYLRLVQFQESRGHCKIPSDFDDPHLVQWVRLLKRTPRSSLGHRQDVMLENIGFFDDPPDSTTDDNHNKAPNNTAALLQTTGLCEETAGILQAGNDDDAMDDDDDDLGCDGTDKGASDSNPKEQGDAANSSSFCRSHLQQLQELEQEINALRYELLETKHRIYNDATSSTETSTPSAHAQSNTNTSSISHHLQEVECERDALRYELHETREDAHNASMKIRTLKPVVHPGPKIHHHLQEVECERNALRYELHVTRNEFQDASALLRSLREQLRNERDNVVSASKVAAHQSQEHLQEVEGERNVLRYELQETRYRASCSSSTENRLALTPEGPTGQMELHATTNNSSHEYVQELQYEINALRYELQQLRQQLYNSSTENRSLTEPLIHQLDTTTAGDNEITNRDVLPSAPVDPNGQEYLQEVQCERDVVRYELEHVTQLFVTERARNKSLSDQLLQLQQTYDSFSNTQQQHHQEIAYAQNALEYELQETREHCKGKQEENKALKDKIQRQLGKMQQERHALHTQLLYARQWHSRATQTYNNRIGALQGELEESNRRCQQSEQQRNQFKEELEKIRQEKRDQDELLKDLAGSFKEAEKKQRDTRRELVESNKRFLQAEQQHKHNKKEIESLLKKRDCLHDEQQTALQNELADTLKKAEKTRSDALARESKLHIALRKAEEERETLRNDLTETRQQLNDIQLKDEQRSIHSRELEMHTRGLEKERNALQYELGETRYQSVLDKQHLLERIGSLVQEQESFRKEIEKRAQETSAALDVFQELVDADQQMGRKLQKLVTERDTLKLRTMDSESARSDLVSSNQQLKRRLESSEKSLAALQRALVESKQYASEATNFSSEQQKKIQELRQKLKGAQKEQTNLANKVQEANRAAMDADRRCKEKDQMNQQLLRRLSSAKSMLAQSTGENTSSEQNEIQHNHNNNVHNNHDVSANVMLQQLQSAHRARDALCTDLQKVQQRARDEENNNKILMEANREVRAERERLTRRATDLELVLKERIRSVHQMKNHIKELESELSAVRYELHETRQLTTTIPRDDEAASEKCTEQKLRQLLFERDFLKNTAKVIERRAMEAEGAFSRHCQANDQIKEHLLEADLERKAMKYELDARRQLEVHATKSLRECMDKKTCPENQLNLPELCYFHRQQEAMSGTAKEQQANSLDLSSDDGLADNILRCPTVLTSPQVLPTEEANEGKEEVDEKGDATTGQFDDSEDLRVGQFDDPVEGVRASVAVANNEDNRGIRKRAFPCSLNKQVDFRVSDTLTTKKLKISEYKNSYADAESFQSLSSAEPKQASCPLDEPWPFWNGWLKEGELSDVSKQQGEPNTS